LIKRKAAGVQTRGFSSGRIYRFIVIKLQIMNKQSESQPKISLLALFKETRETTAKENIRISKELGITPESVLSELKREKQRVLRELNNLNGNAEKLKHLYEYEAYLYSYSDYIEQDWYDCLTILNSLNEIKAQFEPLINFKPTSKEKP
jgi:hypothetical protein